MMMFLKKINNDKLNKHGKRSGVKLSRGFTLLELLLVVVLLGMLALAATALVDNLGEQDRYEITRTRLQQIKEAIIGDTSRTLNGEPMLSGFVADMGRLPSNIQELIDPTLFSAPDIATMNFSGVVGQLSGGWRGPYLDVLPSSGGSVSAVYLDGWGSDWSYVSTTDTVNVLSFGLDGQPGGSGVYEQDYPTNGVLIDAVDWQVSLSGVVFNVEFSKPPNEDIDNLAMQIYSYSGTSYELFDESEVFGLSGVASVSGVQVAQAKFDNTSEPLPMGIHAVVIMCVDVALEATRVFDGRVVGGTCDPSSTHAPYYLKVVPRAQLPSKIIWNIR